MAIIFRKGKTQRDRSRGVLARNIDNKLARANWNNLTTMVRSNDWRGAGAFPYNTCNGKRNRRVA